MPVNRRKLSAAVFLGQFFSVRRARVRIDDVHTRPQVRNVVEPLLLYSQNPASPAMTFHNPKRLLRGCVNVHHVPSETTDSSIVFTGTRQQAMHRGLATVAGSAIESDMAI